MQQKVANLQTNNTKVSKEVAILFPEIKPIAVTQYLSKDKFIGVLLYQSKDKLNSKLNIKLTNWLKQRLEKDSVEVYRQQ